MIICSQIPFSIDFHYTEVKIQLSGSLLQGLTSRGGSVWFHGSTEMGATSTGTQACKENVFIKTESRELPCTNSNAAVKTPPGEPVIPTSSCNRTVQSSAQEIGSLKFELT